MSNQPFNNDSTPDERRDVLQNDRKARDTLPKTTFASFSEALKDEDRGGRFKPETATHVIGSTAIPKYPELPASSPSHHDVVPDEPPLGFSVDEMTPVGSHKEIQASIEKLRAKPEDPEAA
jgi:hypothetical protein